MSVMPLHCNGLETVNEVLHFMDVIVLKQFIQPFAFSFLVDPQSATEMQVTKGAGPHEKFYLCFQI